jgi:hypothetical protein
VLDDGSILKSEAHLIGLKGAGSAGGSMAAGLARKLAAALKGNHG